MTDEQNKEFAGLLGEIKAGWSDLRVLPGAVKALQDGLADQQKTLGEVRRAVLARSAPAGVRLRGQVSEDCAKALAAAFIAHAERSGMMEAVASLGVHREALTKFAMERLGVSTRAALTVSDVPLPASYGSELRELISDFGVVRKAMTHYPITLGSCKPARMGTRVAFGSIAMSGTFAEKAPSLEFASLDSHKLGGIVRVPRELDEQSIVPMGQFLARYGAIEFARAEDVWGFKADGSGTYEGVKGVVKIADDAGAKVELTTGKLSPSEVTIADLRAVRRKVNKAALNARMSAYYLDSSWESALQAMNDADTPYFFQRLPDGRCLLDGFPIVWTDVLQAYTTEDVTASTPVCAFGALRFWWFGEHGAPRMDTSEHVYYVNDQLGVRFIEEIDFDYMASDAMAVVLVAAA
ncbi:MAG TPA: phage major capsid protein [Candidatus Sulfotelmatobacter sp.]|nr:phage major capsid protein [Candidatus Sulfotelmatobacter sp.]